MPKLNLVMHSVPEWSGALRDYASKGLEGNIFRLLVKDTGPSVSFISCI